MYFFTFSVDSESDDLPNQGPSTTAKECNPCNTQGHMVSLAKHEKYVAAAERPPGLPSLPGDRGGDRNGARTLRWKRGGCLSEPMLLKSSCWDHPGKC